MNKERKVIEPNTIVVFDDNVKASKLNSLLTGLSRDAIITKKLILDCDLDIKCNLHVIGDISRKNRMNECEINIDGDLYSYRKISCSDINVTGTFHSEGIIYSANIKVGGDMICYEETYAYDKKIVVMGDLICKRIVAEGISVLGKTSIDGLVSAKQFVSYGISVG